MTLGCKDIEIRRLWHRLNSSKITISIWHFQLLMFQTTIWQFHIFDISDFRGIYLNRCLSVIKQFIET